MRDIPTLADREELETSSTDVRTALQPAVVTPNQALPIKPFGLDMNVLLTTEALAAPPRSLSRGTSPAKARPTMSISNRKRFCLSSRVSMR
jgi:hypothetical protein